MKRTLTAIFAGALVLQGISASGMAVAQSAKQDLTNVPNGISVTNFSVTDTESDPSVEARNLEREFQGANLNAQQRTQITQARRQFRTDLRRAITSPGSLGTIFRLAFSPKAQAQQAAESWVGKPFQNYSTAVSRVLSAEQLVIWQRNLKNGAFNQQR